MADGATFDPVLNAVRVTQVISSSTSASGPPTTGTQSNVNDGAASVTILAANTGRKGACFYNDSTVLLYLLLGAGTASATVYSVQLNPGGFYELPLMIGGAYTGIVKGIWSSDASGAVRVTEFT